MAEVATATELRFYGYSDDLVEVEGIVQDEFDVGDQATLEVQVAGHRKFRVHADYDGCWRFAVAQLDQGYHLPEFGFRIEQYERNDRPEGSYSTQLVIALPDGTSEADVAVRPL